MEQIWAWYYPRFKLPTEPEAMNALVSAWNLATNDVPKDILDKALTSIMLSDKSEWPPTPKDFHLKCRSLAKENTGFVQPVIDLDTEKRDREKARKRLELMTKKIEERNEG
jgi:hypothetical protein